MTEICRRLDGIPLAIELAASRMVSMTATEVRDHLDDRFRLLVGSRRGIERHQTLRQAVQWSYDLLTEDEKSLLTACSVFAGGFDLAGAAAIGGSADEYATLDVLDALVRKSLLVADRASGRTRYSMLETIRQFAEGQLAQRSAADAARTAHARYFAGLEADVLALWDGPRQCESYLWLTLELANLRAAFRWSADHRDIDTAATIASYAALLGMWIEQYEPAAWAGELIEPARAVEHPRLAQLYVLAAQCYTAGRLEQAAEYLEASQTAITSGRFDEVAPAAEASLGAPCILTAGAGPMVEWCQSMTARRPDAAHYGRSLLAMALTILGRIDEAATIAEDVLGSADSIGEPLGLCFVLNGFGYSYRAIDPAAAHEALRRGVALANESGNRNIGSQLAVNLSMIAITRDDPGEAFHFITMAIRNYHDSGNYSLLSSPLAILAVYLVRLGHYEAASTISGAADTPFTRAGYPEIITAISRLRQVLGDEAHAALASAGSAMSNTGITNYAFDQIDRVRGELG